MEACDTRVTLGNTVCAPKENALLCISANRVGMGATAIASGRSPSIERIRTRRAKGAKVGVSVGEGVSLGIAVRVAVAVGLKVGVCVAVEVEVGKSKDILGVWGS